MVQGKGAALLTEFAGEVEVAEAAKASQAGAGEKKAAKAATSLVEYLASVDREEALREQLGTLIENLGQEVESTFDKANGTRLAESVAKVLGIDEEYRPAGFEQEKAADLVKRWKAATGGRGSGASSVPESQKVPAPIKVTFTFPDGRTESIQHNSTWSSVSNEITKRAKVLDGVDGAGYTRPDSAKDAWRAVTADIKAGGEGGVVTIPTTAGDLVAEVIAVR